MKKKAGIITLSASDNCGSLLQTFALQQYLSDALGLDIKVIDFESEESKKVYSIFPKGFFKHPKKTLFTIRHFFSIKKQREGYRKFREEKLFMTNKRYKNVKELSELAGNFDYLISGSDQVWNINMSDFNCAFYLPWKDTAKKISYAASLGSMSSVPDEYKERVGKWLSDYSFISVRENTGKETLKNYTKKEITVTLDPTLLLKPEEWDAMVGERLIKDNYIFYYSWSYPDEEMHRIVERFAEERGLKVYVINSTKWYHNRPKKYDFELFKESGPDVFLNLMKYAEYVFVQSFHGTVFANVFRKKFFFLNEKNNGEIDFRSMNLISMLHQENVIIHDLKDINNALKNEINYDSTEYRNAIEVSKAFLKKSLE